MKLLAVNSARSIWLVPTMYLNPHGRHIASVIPALAERYQFLKVPPLPSLAARPTELKFEGGSFTDRNGVATFVNLSVHDDGLVAETRASTEVSDRFLEDALTWVAETFGLPHYSQNDVQKIYASELVATLELPARLFSDPFSRFVDRLKQGVSNNPGKPMEFLGVQFGPDPTLTRKTAAFKVERVTGTSFDRNEYYCVAPVPTGEHVELLEMMERAAGG